MSQEIAVSQALLRGSGPGDEVLLKMWLHGKSHNTALAYRSDVEAFLAFTRNPVAVTTLGDIQRWDGAMRDRGDVESSRIRRLGAVRSLFKFALSLGWIQVNPAALLTLAKPRSFAADRIVGQADVLRLIGAEPSARKRALLRLLYVCGLRASEAACLTWRDMVRTKKGFAVRVLGKGSKERTIYIGADLWGELADLTPHASPASPVVPGRDGKPLDRKAVHRAVKSAVRRVGLDPAISPHWLRHSCATHALENGAPVSVVRDTLGHSSLATTSRYVHGREGDSAGAYLKG